MEACISLHIIAYHCIMVARFNLPALWPPPPAATEATEATEPRLVPSYTAIALYR